MKKILNAKAWFLILAMVPAVTSISCTKSKSSNKSKDVPAEGPKKFAFNDAAPDGRPTQFADFTSLSNINLAKLDPMTAEFYGVSSETNVKILNDPADIDILWKFTNIQESIPVSDFINAVKRGCAEEALGTLKNCLDTVIKQSGAIVFEPVVPLTKTNDPNDTNLILDAAYNTMGITVVNVHGRNGTIPSLMVSCVSCHSSSRTFTDSAGVKTLTINMAGDNSTPDVMRTGNAATYLDKAKAILANPNDPIWNSSPKAKAAGLLAAQYNRLRDIHGTQLYATDADLRNYATNISAPRAVNSGWVFAMMAAATAARGKCSYWNDGVGGDCAYELEDVNVAKRTERVVLNEFLQGGTRADITSELLASGNPLTIPSREMRSLLPLRTDLPRNGMPDGSIFIDNPMGYNPNFAIEYLDWSGENLQSKLARSQASSRYLLGATAMAALMPAAIDNDLAALWYGSTVTGSVAKETIYSQLPRTVVSGYKKFAETYHLARENPVPEVSSSFAPVLSESDAASAQSYVQQTCHSCHASATIDLLSSAVQNCGFGTTCVIGTDPQYDDKTGSSVPVFNTPTSDFAFRMFQRIATVPEALSGYNFVAVNSLQGINTLRLPLFRRQALTDWNYASFADALSPSPHGPQFAVMSPVVSIEGNAQVRKLQTNVNLGLSNPAQPQELRCAQSALFDLDGNGVAESSCYDTLRTLAGATPRPLGEGHVVATHASVPRPGSLGSSATAVSKYLQGLDVGRIRIRSNFGSVEKDIIFKLNDDCRANNEVLNQCVIGYGGDLGGGDSGPSPGGFGLSH